MSDVPNEQRPAPANVVQAIARIMEELPGIGRDSESGQGYKFRGIEAITAQAQRLMGRYCVVFAAHVLSRQTKDLTVNGKPWTEEQLEISYTVYGPGGIEDRIEVGPFIGLGRDNSDKGTNKAESQAFKYALIQTFCIGDSKDDADHDAAHEADALVDPSVWFPANGWSNQADHDESTRELVETLRALPSAAKASFKAWRIAAAIGTESGFGVLTRDEWERATDAVAAIVDGVDPATGERLNAPGAADTPDGGAGTTEPPQGDTDHQGAESAHPCDRCGSTRTNRVWVGTETRCVVVKDCNKRRADRLAGEPATEAPQE